MMPACRMHEAMESWVLSIASSSRGRCSRTRALCYQPPSPRPLDAPALHDIGARGSQPLHSIPRIWRVASPHIRSFQRLPSIVRRLRCAALNAANRWTIRPPAPAPPSNNFCHGLCWRAASLRGVFAHSLPAPLAACPPCRRVEATQ